MNRVMHLCAGVAVAALAVGLVACTGSGAGAGSTPPSANFRSEPGDAQVRDEPGAGGADSGAWDTGGSEPSGSEGGSADPGLADSGSVDPRQIDSGGTRDGALGSGGVKDGAVEASGPVDAVAPSMDGAVPVGSAGCGKAATAPSPTVQQTMQVSGTTRYYLLDVPSGYSPTTPLPVIFAFHGLNMNNVWVSQGGGWFGSFNLQAASGGHAILLFPQGSGSPPGSGTTLSGTSSWNNNAADMGFFDALVAYVENTYCVDTNRVFATGFSMGAMFTNALGCDRANVVRAIAPIEGWGPGSPPTTGTPSCPSSKGKAAMVTHGTADKTIPYSIGQASAEFWRAASGCSATTAASTAFPNCVSYEGCQTGREAYLCTHAGDHQVPTFAGTNLWNFFSALH